MQRSTKNKPATQSDADPPLNPQQSLEDVWKERAHKLGKLVYNLEIQKRDLQKKLQVAGALHSPDPEGQQVLKLHNELLQLKAKVQQQEDALKERETLLKIAAGKARAEVLALKAKYQEEGAADSGTIPAAHTPYSSMFISPAKAAHVDVATLQSMLREREKDLAIYREDNAAKEKELLHALELLQGMHTRESELRRQAQNLAKELELARDALQQSNGDVDNLQKEIAAMGGEPLDREFEQDELDLLRAEINELGGALAVARHEAEVFQDKAAMLESALRASEESNTALRDKVVALQEFVISMEDHGSVGTPMSLRTYSTERHEDHGLGSEVILKGGLHTALALGRTILLARCAVQALSILSRFLSK